MTCRLLAIVGLVAGLAAGCGRKPYQTLYLKGPPQRVEVTKHVEPATVTYRATRTGDLIRVMVLERAPVRLERAIARSTYVVEARGDWKWEWVETLACLVLVPFVPFFGGADAGLLLQGPEVKNQYNGSFVTACPDPRRTLIGAKFTGRFSTEDAFAGPPEQRRYHVGLPLPAEHVHYRVITAEHVIAMEGEATTSRFGEIEIPHVPDDAVAVEVVHRGRTQLIVLEGATAAR